MSHDPALLIRLLKEVYAYPGTLGGVAIGPSISRTIWSGQQMKEGDATIARATRWDLDGLEFGARATNAFSYQGIDSVMHEIVKASNVPFYDLIGIPD